MKTQKLIISLIAATLLMGCNNSEGLQMLRIEALEEPSAIDNPTPDFSWQLRSDKQATEQLSYQIKVATDSKMSNLVWDSGIVNNSESHGILYGSTGQAAPLQPESDYFWQVTIRDNHNNTHTARSRFATGLMNPAIEAWEGAEWIGSQKTTLDAASSLLFHIRTKYRLISGDKFSLIFGADDFRLNDSFQNSESVEGENYIRVEIDHSDSNNPKINIFRVGYTRNDTSDRPFLTISEENYPPTNLPKLLTSANKGEEHLLEVKCSASSLTLLIDSTPVTLGRTTSFSVNPMGSGGNFNSFPNLCSVGFAVEEGGEVALSDYTILNVGQSEPTPLFGAEVGATYKIFDEIEGVKIDGNTITLTNGAFGYADPSHYGSVTMLRSTFTPKSEIASAKLYVTAMGVYEFYINGERVGDDWFNPGMSQYREVLPYHAYDITNHLDNKTNALGAIVAPGFFTGYMTFTPENYNFWGDHEALLAKMVITYTDGTKEVVVTNPESWKAYTDGPIEFAGMFQGERYNAYKEAAIEGWNESDYNDEAWQKPDVITPRSWIDFEIVARRDRPVRVVEELEAQRVLTTHSDDGTTYTYDMGVTMVGVPSVTIPAGALTAGDQVILRYGEEIYPGNEDSPNKVMPDGTTYESLYGPNGSYHPGVAGRVLHDTYRAALATDFYTAADDKEVTIRPSFTYRGYRYIQITIPSRNKPLPLGNVKGIVLSSEPVSGSYHGTTTDESGALVNQLFTNIQRSQLGNFFSIPTDCPQRNERMGWTGDAQAYSRTATYNGDVQSFFRQWMVALRHDQGVGSDNAPAGGIGSTVPTYQRERDRSFADGTTWAAAICMVPWQLYQQYGDKEIIRENFDAMMLWLNGMNEYKIPGYEALSSRTTGLADWLSIDLRTSSDICNNAIYIAMIDLTSRMAREIGRAEEADMLAARYAKAKEEFNRAYVNAESGYTQAISLATGLAEGIMDSQSSYATPLGFDLFSDTMYITDGEYKGMSYKAFAAKRLAELAADPSQSGVGGTINARRSLSPFDRGALVENPTAGSLPYTITTGFSATPNILPALTRNGYVEEAYKMLTATDYASWLYPVKLGSTSMWERWNSYELAFKSEGESSMNSFNHFALGSVGAWLWEYHLGITTESGKGYKEFVLQPMAGGNYTSADGTYQSAYGAIRSAWKADAGQIYHYECSVPANTSATLYLPVDEAAAAANTPKGATFVGMTTRHNKTVAEFNLPSGEYEFDLR